MRHGFVLSGLLVLISACSGPSAEPPESTPQPGLLGIGTSCLSSSECDQSQCSTSAICAGVNSEGICRCSCGQNSDCRSGCCVPLSNEAGAVCADVSFCAGECQAAGQPCTGNAQCCGYPNAEICITDGFCHSTCLIGADCKSGCCVPSTINGVASTSVCAAPSNCQ